MIKLLSFAPVFICCLMQGGISSKPYDIFTFGNSESKIMANKNDSLRNKAIVENYFVQFSDKKKLPVNELIAETALAFAGFPYAANTLEDKGDEYLIVNLNEFDCTTFVENILALALELKSENPSFDGFKCKLRNLRYKNGEIDGYLSRNHYMLDWISNNRNNGIIEDITLQLGGKSISKRINFMSSHAEKYPLLINSPQMIDQLKKIEHRINEQIVLRDNFILLAKENLQNILKMLHIGDIILFATNTKGLDYSHMGFIIYDNDDEPKLLHASSGKNKKVIVDTKTLNEYLMDSSNCNGVTILRLKTNL